MLKVKSNQHLGSGTDSGSTLASSHPPNLPVSITGANQHVDGTWCNLVKLGCIEFESTVASLESLDQPNVAPAFKVAPVFKLQIFSRVARFVVFHPLSSA